jgi:hypothetical protein
VFLIATFAMTVVGSGRFVLERAEEAAAAAGTKKPSFLYAAASAPHVLLLLWAFLSDRVALWGTRREGYVLFTALLVPIAWLLTVLPGDHHALWIVAALLFGTASAVARAAPPGALAEIGQRRAATGSLSAAFIAVAQLGVLASFALSTASELLSPWITFGVAIGLSLAVVLLVITAADEGTAPSPALPPGAPRPSIPRFLGSRAFWSSFAVCVLAGAATVPNELLVNPQKTSEGAAASLAPWMIHVCFIGAAASYFVGCRRIRFGVLLRVTLTLKAAALLLYPFVDGGSGGASIAFLVRATANGLLSVALLDMATRVAPPGREAFATMLLAGVTTVVITMSNALEASLGIPSLPVSGFAAGAAIAAAIATLLLPRRFLETADGRVIGSPT